MPVTQMYASLYVGISTAVRALRDAEAAEKKLADQVGRESSAFAEMLAERQADIDLDLRRQLEYQLMKFREAVEEMKPYSPLDK
ncbi:hypothetical protein Q0N25_13715, partial [Staphylococcus aureus]|nr:hypothetical protein [Staphylococcus aureus]